MNNIKRELQELKFSNLSIRVLSYLALFIAMIALATYFIKIPGLNTSYYNLGEAFIFLVGIVFGAKAGLITGALGSALVDLILAPIWAPFTLVIKGVEGWVVGKLAEEGSLARKVLAILVAGHIMIIGYALSVWLLYGWPAVLPEIVGNYGQVTVGAIIALPLARTMDKILKK